MDLSIVMLFAILFVCSVWLFIGLVIYFIPVVVAYIRRHNNILAITILTLFLGWTFFGWLASLLWSLNSDIKEEED